MTITEKLYVTAVDCFVFTIWDLGNWLVNSFSERDKCLEQNYIVTIVKYLIKWVEVERVEFSTKDIAHIYENIITWFIYPMVIISDREHIL